MAGQNYQKSRPSSTTGKNAPYKKDGYASGKTPDSMIGTKDGKTDKKPYSGPSVQKGSFR